MKRPYEFLSRTGDGVCVVDRGQRIVLWNEAATRLLGFAGCGLNAPRDLRIGDLAFHGVPPECAARRPPSAATRAAAKLNQAVALGSSVVSEQTAYQTRSSLPRKRDHVLVQ